MVTYRTADHSTRQPRIRLGLLGIWLVNLSIGVTHIGDGLEELRSGFPFLATYFSAYLALSLAGILLRWGWIAALTLAGTFLGFMSNQINSSAVGMLWDMIFMAAMGALIGGFLDLMARRLENPGPDPAKHDG